MLEAIKINRLLMWIVGLNVGYWSFGAVAAIAEGGGIWWSAFVSACLLVSGSLLASTVLPDAFRVARKGQVGSGEMAVIAIALMSGGLMWAGAFSIVYSYYGRPESWIGPLSSYGRAAVSVGMFLMFLAPAATRRGLRAPRWWAIVAGVVLIAIMGFVFGAMFAVEQSSVSGAFDTSRGARMVDLLQVRKA